MSDLSAIGAIGHAGIVPLVSVSNESGLASIVAQASQAEVPALEVTLRQAGSLEAFEAVLATNSDGPMLGAGTVLEVEQAARVIDAGAQFVFSPVLDLAVGERCSAAGVAWIPGCATPSEVKAALDAGCTAVKLFPADTLGGPAFLEAVRAVFGDFAAIPSGGILPNVAALRAWYKAGATAVGIGSAIVSSELVRNQAWSTIGTKLAAAMAAAQEARTLGDSVA